MVYPFYATTFIWSAVIAWAWAGESINGWMISGIIVIVLGLALVARGAAV